MPIYTRRYIRNSQKLDRICNHGQTVDLPLFDGGDDPPSRIPNHAITERNDAYYSIVPKLGNDEMLVYGVLLREGPLTDLQIAEKLGWTINRVTGRRNGLADKGRVARYGTVLNEATGRKNALWYAVKNTKEM
ncbi:MAG TPA: hypothetical protein PK916_09060 [Bacteroidota bacterium]|nr:hypothetical protein [Bacteroidota bacterium]